MWFHGNEGYEYANPDLENVTIFDYWSNPNSRTVDGSDSFLSINILSEISNTMQIHITFNNDVEIIYLTDTTSLYLGNGYNESDSTAVVYYAKDGQIYAHASDSSDEFLIDTLNYNVDKLIYTYQDTLEYMDAGSCIHPTCENIEDDISPLGYIYSDLDSTTFPAALSFGDIDHDGLDEIITIEDGDLVVKNGNQTLVNGFPLKGDFSGIPLIANILSVQDSIPEIICREGENITILSNKGDRLRQLSSFNSVQPLAMVPFWDGKMALIDGSRLFLFDLDMDHSYWLNPRSRPSGFPLSIGNHFEPDNSSKMRTNAYNYPNPVTDGSTTFRFYVRSPEVSEVKVNIYNAAGYLVEDNLIKKDDDLSYYEFNEIIWDASQFDAGLYLAEIKPNLGNSELVRLVVIK